MQARIHNRNCSWQSCQSPSLTSDLRSKCLPRGVVLRPVPAREEQICRIHALLKLFTLVAPVSLTWLPTRRMRSEHPRPILSATTSLAMSYLTGLTAVQ